MSIRNRRVRVATDNGRCTQLCPTGAANQRRASDTADVDGPFANEELA
jgi:hypothetical protein